MARSCMRMVLMIALPVMVMACAQGFQGNDDDDDDPPRVDAPGGVIDAANVDGRILDAPASTIDGPGIPIDAPISVTDGPIGTGCTDNTQCGAGMCCFGQLMCVAGEATPFPPPFNCLPE